jgi:hypothetical protein
MTNVNCGKLLLGKLLQDGAVFNFEAHTPNPSGIEATITGTAQRVKRSARQRYGSY